MSSDASGCSVKDHILSDIPARIENLSYYDMVRRSRLASGTLLAVVVSGGVKALPTPGGAARREWYRVDGAYCNSRDRQKFVNKGASPGFGSIGDAGEQPVIEGVK